METPESIERMLERRLVPGAMSVEGSRGLEALIDDLSKESSQASVRWTSYAIGAVAAGLTLFAGVVISNPSIELTPLAEVGGLFSEAREVVLIEGTEGVVSAEEEQDLLLGANGSLHRAWHIQVLSEERFHDEQTGHHVRVVHPRDELVMMPVTSF